MREKIVANTSTAFIAGASRGLGLAIARSFLERGWRVIATMRAEGGEGLVALAKEFPDALTVDKLDVTSGPEIAALRGRLEGRVLDVLFVNAGVLDEPTKPIGEVATAEFLRLMETNALAPLRVIEALHPLTPAGGVIGAMSSGLGSVARNDSGGFEAYRASKAALDIMLRSFAARAGRGRAIIAMDPGWVRTDMGGAGAPLSLAESAPGVAATLIAQAGKGGSRFLNYRGEPVAW